MPGALNGNDPRVVRTRQLILNAFFTLLDEKEFTSITVSDITKKATINRATFYAHFNDKYALLNVLMEDALMDFIYKRISPQARLNNETIKNLVLSLCDYQTASSNRCVKNYESIAPFVEQNMKQQLERYMFSLLSREKNNTEKEVISRRAIFISGALYGITYRWNVDGRTVEALSLAEEILPMLAACVSVDERG